MSRRRCGIEVLSFSVPTLVGASSLIMMSSGSRGLTSPWSRAVVLVDVWEMSEAQGAPAGVSGESVEGDGLSIVKMTFE